MKTSYCAYKTRVSESIFKNYQGNSKFERPRETNRCCGFDVHWSFSFREISSSCRTPPVNEDFPSLFFFFFLPKQFRRHVISKHDPRMRARALERRIYFFALSRFIIIFFFAFTRKDGLTAAAGECARITTTAIRAIFVFLLSFFLSARKATGFDYFPLFLFFSIFFARSLFIFIFFLRARARP